jgi:hypothetical protein
MALKEKKVISNRKEEHCARLLLPEISWTVFANNSSIMWLSGNNSI